MALNLPQKEERQRWTNKIKRWTDTGWMYIKRAANTLKNRITGVGISESDAQQKAKNIKNSLEIKRKQFELKH